MNNWIEITPTSVRKLSIHFNEFGDRLPEFMKVGRQVKYESGTIELIGDINENGGGCDCCGSDGIVVAYRDLEIPNE